MKTIYKLLSLTACMVLANANAMAERTDTLVLMSGSDADMPSTQYTLTFKQLQLKDASSEAIIKLRTGDNSSGCDIHISSNRIYAISGSNEVTIAENMPDGLLAHDYSINRVGTIRIYRDGTQYGTCTARSYNDNEPRIVLANTDDISSYEFELTSSSSNVVPDSKTYETNISNMLEFTNLSPDPYLNSGFDRSGENASGRSSWTMNAKNNGWGSEIWLVGSSEAYSGPSCVKLEGQSVYSNSGASLQQVINFSSNVPYVVRAMVKSDGWEGKIGIGSEPNHIDIRDTHGEWKQVEAVLIAENQWNVSDGTLIINNADYESNGTLLIDNIEVYRGLTGTAIGSNKKVVSANVNATTRWSPAHEVDVYRLGMTENNANVYSQINPELVSVSGAAYFTRSFEGSRMSGIFFPNGVGNVTVSGRFDYRDHYEYHLYHGIDFICQRLNPETGRFEYLSEDDELTAGGYIIQFADNYDGMPVRFDLNPSDRFVAPDSKFNMLGNTEYQNMSFATYDEEAEDHLLFFDESLQQFNRVGSTNSNAECLRPFMPFIQTKENVHVISPEGTTGIRILNAAQGTFSKYVVRPVAHGVEITGHGSSKLGIYNVAGQRVKMIQMEEGVNVVSLEPGIYIVAGKKVMVR